MKYIEWKRAALDAYKDVHGITSDDVFWLSLDLDRLFQDVLDSDICKRLPLSYDMSSDELKTLTAAWEKYCSGMPIPRITGFTYFYGHKIKTSPDVLIPREDSEILVATAFEQIRKYVDRSGDRNLAVFELCVGSGCLSIALADLFRSQYGDSRTLKILATDISPAAIKLAKDNIRAHDLEETVFVEQADLWPSIAGDVSVPLVFSNPPYLKKKEFDDSSLGLYEPELALASGEDGLFLIRRILNEGAKKLQLGTVLCLEHGFEQAEGVEALSQSIEPWQYISCNRDLADRPRVSVLKLGG